ncbi:MAG: hypothetical protein IPM34_00455 [Saprospiraceae bacterium]|nr:hypothetical protein [Saprospiraceae bacterium]
MEQAHKMVDYSNQTISVGIDVHLTSWYITVYFDRLYIKSFRQDPCPANYTAIWQGIFGVNTDVLMNQVFVDIGY